MSGPPRILSEPQTERVRVAQLVRLHCVVDADPPALVQWTKDDEGIHSGWERVKVGPSSLRIRDVTVEDAGHYVCKATNGFGSVSLEHHLYVVGKCFAQCCLLQLPTLLNTFFPIC